MKKEKEQKVDHKLLILTIVTILLVSASLTINQKSTGITGMAVGLGQGCCELTCTETSAVECPANLFNLGESCFSLESCNIGCCIDGEGYCYSNYLRSSCERYSNKFVRGRECFEYKQCLVAPPFPADQEGYLFNSNDGVLVTLVEPYSGRIGTKFKISVTTLNEETDVKINLSSSLYQELIELKDDGLLLDKFVNDEEYTAEWDSKVHNTVWQITPVTLQSLIDGTKSGIEETFFISPTDCVPSNPTWNKSATRTNIIFAKKPNLDYVNLQSKGVGLWHQLIEDLERVQQEYELYHLENTRESVTEIASDCGVGMGENDLIILFDYDEEFCQQNGNVVIASNAIKPKSNTVIRGENFTKNFCDYVHSPIQDQQDLIDSFQNPIIEIINPAENISTTESTIDVTFKISDNQSGKIRYKIFLDEDRNQLAWGYIQANETITRTIKTQDGIHELYVVGEDLESNTIGEQRYINVSVENFMLYSNLEAETISLETFSIALNATHDNQENLTTLIFDGWSPVAILNLTVNQTRTTIFNLTQETHEIWAVAYDNNGRRATTWTSEVEVFATSDTATSPPQRLSLEINAIDSLEGENHTPETINYAMYITQVPQTITFDGLDNCGLDLDTGEENENPSEIIDEYCLEELRITDTTLELDFSYSHGGESYIQSIQVNGTLEETNFSEQRTIAVAKPSGEFTDKTTITIGSPGLSLLTGAFLWFDNKGEEEERFSPTVSAPSWVGEEGVAGYTGATETPDTADDQGCVIGPDNKKHCPIDDSGFYEPQLLCAGNVDQGIMYRPIDCIDSWTTDIQIETGLKTEEEGKYKYQLNYEVFSCNENVFVDVYLKGCQIPGAPPQVGLQEEELYSTTLDVSYKLTSTETYESQLDCTEFCIFVSDTTVSPVPVCQPFELPQCNDQIDNEQPGDGLIDMDDPGCSEPNDNDEGDGTSECQDNEDNDRDGLTDEDDPGCHEGGSLRNPYKPTHNNEAGATTQCQDNVDNEGDTVCDYAGCTIGGTTMPADPGCSSPTDDREDDGTTECQDGIDNDNDGRCDNGCDVQGFYLPPDHGCFVDLSCYPHCYDQTINDENKQVPVCYLSDDNIIELDAEIFASGSDYRYKLDYAIHACRNRMIYKIYLQTFDGTQVHNILSEEGRLVKDQSDVIIDYSTTQPTQYDELCIWMAGEGTQCTTIRAGI